MKNLLILFLFIGFTGFMSVQSNSPKGIFSSGDYFENTLKALNMTLDEIVRVTFEINIILIPQGFQQPEIENHMFTGFNKLKILTKISGEIRNCHLVNSFPNNLLNHIYQPINTYLL